jgi:hypothetical protein
MPTTPRREDAIVQQFLSGYENRSWADAQIEWLDKTMDGAVEARATRKSDGKTVAIEHTIIEPFVGDKSDFASFETAFLQIEQDKSLLVPGRWIRLFIPIGTLQGRKREQDAIVKAVRDWLKRNRTSLKDGFSEHRCDIAGVSGQPSFSIALCTRVIPLPGNGDLHVRRQQIEENLGDVIEKALKKKLSKLVGTAADRHILILERQHMNLYPDRMLEEIEKRQTTFPELAKIHEIWIVETMFYERESFLRFERFAQGTLVESLDFQGDKFLAIE